MIKCQACGSQNPDTAQYCDECGDALMKYQAPQKEDPVPSVAETSVESPPPVNPVFQQANVTSVGVPPIESVEEETADVSNEEVEEIAAQPESGSIHSKLLIERGQAIGTEFPLSADESNIGRWDADNGVFPDVDLDAHDPEAKVSRKHARILSRGDQFMIEDLGSTNGTFVNRGRRLIPGNPHILNDGDELIVGKTFLRFQVVK